jgi:hypothetical protein
MVLELLKHGGESGAIQLQGKVGGSLFPSSSELYFYDPMKAWVTTAYTPNDVVHRVRGAPGGFKGLKQRELDHLDIRDSTALVYSLIDPERWLHPVEFMNACMMVAPNTSELPLQRIFASRRVPRPLSHAEWETMLLDPLTAKRGVSWSESGLGSDEDSPMTRTRSRTRASSLWSVSDVGNSDEQCDDCDDPEEIVVRPQTRSDVPLV